MPTYPLGGITKLSQLIMDADRDAAGIGLSNLKELAAGMVQGDLVVKGGGGILIRIPADVMGLVLTSNGPLAVPSWKPGGLYYNRYYPVMVYSNVAVQVRALDESITKPAPLISSLASTDNRVYSPEITDPKSVAVVVPDETITKSAPIASTFTTAVA